MVRLLVRIVARMIWVGILWGVLGVILSRVTDANEGVVLGIVISGGAIMYLYLALGEDYKLT